MTRPLTDTRSICARIMEPDDVPRWHQLRREMALFDMDVARDAINSCSFAKPSQRPHLLFNADQLPAMQARLTGADQDLLAQRCASIIEDITDPIVDDTIVCYATKKIVAVAEGALLLEDEQFASWVSEKMMEVLSLSTWMAPVHRQMCRRCDHVMANIAADVTYARDLLGDKLYSELDEALGQGVRRLCFLPYLEGAIARDEHWSRDENLGNWKIMTHGETGLATCAFAHTWPEAREALALATDGVVEILDAVPPEGDWPEGVGYWYATLFMGLRFGLALRRLTNGAVDILSHPRLGVTGDFGTGLITASGKCFGYGDNIDTLNSIGRTTNCNAYPAEALFILAREEKRVDWEIAARHFASKSPLWLALEGEDPTPTGPVDTLTSFPSSGVTTMRSGNTFVGFRCGDPGVGHSHLDANSFVVETAGSMLLIDEGMWPYAHFLGFFDRTGPRWNFDGLATVGHNAILVDGQGQSYSTETLPTILPGLSGPNWMQVGGEAAACYPGLLKNWTRSLVLIDDRILIVRDVIACLGERHIEWLLHTKGQFEDRANDTVVTDADASICITPLLPDRSNGWRVSDTIRRSTYENSNTGEIEHPTVRYRSFSPFRPAESCEFLFLCHLGSAEPCDYDFDNSGQTWELKLDSNTITPDGDRLGVLSRR